ncbi:OmpA family protein [Pseudoalteromonas sp. MelDa3]|uniref:OmpA family protein n=1 Tax=Pseudoalteromonas sp. MelDa3 TaxID=888435 RepID=UPI000CB7A52E|nr:OmpA family protein [Pseudoalteromonas sp. MelDa3]PLT23858.1 OmpA family protein [Pseudoalteromonas sp. MelDa3]
MKAHNIFFAALILLLGGCASWPDEGQGGWAEKYQNYPLDDEQEDSNYTQPEEVIRSEFEHLVLKLELLKSQDIQSCMPAQLLKSQIYENRIRRLIAAQMWEDAEHDLLIHYHDLNQLTNHFSLVRQATHCAEESTSAEATLSVKKQVSDLLNSDNQFAFNEFEITPKYATRLAQAADLVKQVSSVTILLIGHTDSLGEVNNNYELALKRADTVKHWLEVYGVPNQSLTTLTQGSLKPYSDESNSTTTHHSDRRVEAIVLDANESIQQNKKVKALMNWTKVIERKKE